MGSHLRVTYNGIIYLIGTDLAELHYFIALVLQRGEPVENPIPTDRFETRRRPRLSPLPLGFQPENPRPTCFEWSAVYPDLGFVREYSPHSSSHSPDMRARFPNLFQKTPSGCKASREKVRFFQLKCETLVYRNAIFATTPRVWAENARTCLIMSG